MSAERRMSAAGLINTCAACGAEESLDNLLHRMIDDDDVRRLVAELVMLNLALGGLVGATCGCTSRRASACA